MNGLTGLQSQGFAHGNKVRSTPDADIDLGKRLKGLQDTSIISTSPLFTVGKGEGMVKPGNIDLASRPTVKNPDGSISTVRSMALTINDGRVILIPTVSPEGRIMSDEEAIEHSKKTRQHLGVFENQEAADIYAEQLHQQQAEMYLTR